MQNQQVVYLSPAEMIEKAQEDTEAILELRNSMYFDHATLKAMNDDNEEVGIDVVFNLVELANKQGGQIADLQKLLAALGRWLADEEGE